MDICFKNNAGSVEMGRNGDIRIISISGLASPKKIRNTASYAGIAGAVLLSETPSARTITVSGDIKISPYSDAFMSKMLRVLDKEGILYIKNSKKRCIKCSVSDIEFSPKGRVYKEFIIQFTADYPYFTDNEYRQAYLFSRVKNIIPPFTLPRIFSKRVNEAEVRNTGDIRSYPTVKVHFYSDCSENARVTIYNDTTQKSLAVLHRARRGDIVTVDAENRIITSERDGNIENITSSVSDDSYISDLYFEPGKNDIRIILENCGEAEAECLYKNSYIEDI
ncbi:MAG: phage tail family protein [Oscillospiraceae bacterium]|nr:phage tail family protein [Oscillospiraceae bacterium]